MTSASAIAYTGSPESAAISIPLCCLPQRAPNSELTMPASTGQRRLPAYFCGTADAGAAGWPFADGVDPAACGDVLLVPAPVLTCALDLCRTSRTAASLCSPAS